MSTHEQYSDIPRGQVVGTYDTYVEAQRAVDFLSDKQFPVENVSIVGSDLKMVENVSGRLTRGRAALAGAASGAWFGLFVGVLLSLFADRAPTSSAWCVCGIALRRGVRRDLRVRRPRADRRQARLHLPQQDRRQLATSSAAPGPRPTRPARCWPG